MEFYEYQTKFKIQNQDETNNKKLQQKVVKFNEIPNERTHMEHPTSDIGALLHIIKAGLGSGILVMPFAFKNVGLFVGLFGSCFTGLLVTHTTAVLVTCSQGLCIIFNKNSMSYSDTAEYAFLQSFEGKLKHHASKARHAANIFLFITATGMTVCYVLLIAESLQQVIIDCTGMEFDIRLYTMCTLFLVYPIGIVRLMKFQVPFSAIATVSLLISIIMIFRELLKDLPSLNSQPTVKEITRWPLFISTVFVSMEGIGPIMPIENEMKYPKHLIHPPGLLFIGMTLVTILNTAVGFFGYLKYGDGARAVISLNLPVDWLSQTIKVTVAISVLFTFGLQLNVSAKVVWDGMQLWVSNPTAKQYYLVRSFLIIAIVTLAMVIPSLGNFFSLLGSIGFSMIGVCFPSIIEVAYYSENYGCFRWRLFKDIFLILFGLFVAVVGTYCSVRELFLQD